jgi:hypothetical protein
MKSDDEVSLIDSDVITSSPHHFITCILRAHQTCAFNIRALLAS